MNAKLEEALMKIGPRATGEGRFDEFLFSPRKVMILLAGLGLVLQIGHFLEHATQFAVWLSGGYAWVASAFCGRETPFVSAPLSKAVIFVGSNLFPEADGTRQMMMGMELLHLIGNGVFLATISLVDYLISSKWTRYALYIEGAHLCEHLVLTLSAYFVGTPIGFSTMFGWAPQIWGREAAVGWRVAWHFVMNLLPMPFVMYAIIQKASEAAGSEPSLVNRSA